MNAQVVHIAPHLVNRCPAPLRNLRAWLCWRLVPGERPEDKPDKVPFYADGGARGVNGTPDDRRRLVTFDVARAAAVRSGCDGVGFATFREWGVTAADFDRCVVGDVVDQRVEALVAGTYAEISPSGTGVRAFYRGVLANRKSTARDLPFGFETFSDKGFVTFTGDVIEQCSMLGDEDTVAPLPAVLLSLYGDRFPERGEREPAQRAGLTIKRVRGALARIDPDCDHETWFHAGLACHFELGDEGFEPWDTWSARGTKYPGRARLQVRWRSFGRRDSTAQAVTGRTLLFLAGLPLNEATDADFSDTGGGEPPAPPGDAAPPSPERSEDSLALLFVERHGAGLRWSPGIGWVRSDATRWVRDDNLTRFDAARAVCRNVGMTAEGADRKRLASAKTVNAVVSLAQSDRRIVVPDDAWDANPLELNTPAGVVDLRSGAMRSRLDNDYLMRVTSVAPDFEAPCPTWHRFLDDVFLGDGEVIAFVQRMLGYCLTGDRREQVFFFAYGEARNGKSTLFDLVLDIMGDYALKLPTTTLMTSKHTQHPTELAQLRGRRLALSNELSAGMFWDEARIKELTGDATLTARFMRADFFSFPQTQKHLVSGNYQPRLRGGDPAMARRVVLIPFLAKFEGPRRVKDMGLRLAAEAPAVLAWIIQGAAKWHVDGLQIPQGVVNASREYLAEHDDIGMWMEECCDREDGAMSSASELYRAFSAWKSARGESAPSMTNFGHMVTTAGISKKLSNGWKYVGVRLKPPNELV